MKVSIPFPRLVLLAFLLASPRFLLQAADEPERFGPYVALTRVAEIVEDVTIDEQGAIYLLLNPTHKEKEIILKNSSAYKEGYRKWFNGQYELVSPANQGKAPNEYTDWVETSGNYIEYYMDGQLVLHLAKASVHR